MAIVRDIEGARVLVLGGAGFVGSQLVRELVAGGARVAVYDSFLHGSPAHLSALEDRVRIVHGDILDAGHLLHAFRALEPRFVVNLVGDTYVPTAYALPRRFLRINVEGNLNVLLACAETGVERMVYVSSTEVYGDARRLPLTEDHPLDPVNTYAVTKLAADRLCATMHAEHGIPVLIARIFNCYGPRETEPYLVPEIIRQLDKGPVVRLGNLTARRDLTFVGDTARGLVAALRSDLPDGEAVNVGSGDVHQVKGLAERIGRLMGHPHLDVQVDPRRLRRRDIEVFACDATRLREATGWTPTVAIDEGLGRTIAWYREHGRRWIWEDRVETALDDR